LRFRRRPKPEKVQEALVHLDGREVAQAVARAGDRPTEFERGYRSAIQFALSLLPVQLDSDTYIPALPLRNALEAKANKGEPVATKAHPGAERYTG
jgi:hypothetical protein